MIGGKNSINNLNINIVLYKLETSGKCDAEFKTANAKVDSVRFCMEFCKREPDVGYFSWSASTTECECFPATTCGAKASGDFNFYRIL